MRTIELRMSDKFLEAYNNGELSRAEVERVIGYLSCWACHSERYRHVSIYCKNSLDIDANYYENSSKEMLTYQIGAVLGESGTYSYHS